MKLTGDKTEELREYDDYGKLPEYVQSVHAAHYIDFYKRIQL